MNSLVCSFILALFVVQTVLALSRINETLPIKVPPCDFIASVAISKSVSHANGSLLDLETGITYPNGTHWKESHQVNKVTSVERRGCPCMLGRPCIRKCCPFGWAMNEGKCVAHNHTFRIEGTLGDGTPNSFPATTSVDRFGLLFDNPCKATPPHRLEPNRTTGGKLNIRSEDGHLLNGNESYGPDKYCVDYFLDVQNYDAHLCSSARISDSDKAFLDILFDSAGYMCLSGTVIVSVCLLAFLFSTELTTLYSWSIVSYFVSYLLLYVTNTVVCMDGGKMPIHVCYPIALAYIYASLARLFWLNVMCIEITLTFRTIRSIKRSKKLTDIRKFVFYSIYAWGGSLALIIAIILAEKFIRSDHIMKPNIGGLYCWIQGEAAGWIFYGGPVGALCLTNIGLFIFTFNKIFGHRRDTSILRNKEQDKRRFHLYIKLMIVMGIPTLINIAWLFALPIIAFLVVCFICVITETTILVSIAFTAKARERIIRALWRKPNRPIQEKGTINF